MTTNLTSRNGHKAIGINTNGNNRLKKALRLLLTILAVLAGIGTLCYVLWKRGTFLPHWIVWESREAYDQSGTYRIWLQGRRIQVFAQDKEIWFSPEDIKVQDALSCDIDHDRQDELLLLCWKVGRYGNHKPFWVDADENKWSQHIFVYEYAGDEIRPKWMSSYIGQDVVHMEENGKEIPQKRLWLTDTDGTVSSWKWDSWGFTKEETEISFAVFGDLIAHEPIYRYGLSQDGDFSFLFENVEKILAQKDVTVINQETPLTDDPAKYSDYPRFGTPAQVGRAIADAGFDVVTCATNHALDRGAEGVRFTKRFFEEKGVLCLGIQDGESQGGRAYEIVTRKGVRFALFNYTYGTNGIRMPDSASETVWLLEDEEKIRKELQNAKEESDLVIVFVHWGTENSEETDDFQKKWAQVFLESGVDVVIGTHPHAMQPVEVLSGEEGHQMLIYYSIGNFLSAQPEKSCIKGGMAEFTVSLTQKGYRVTEYDLVPLRIVWHEDGKYITEPE